MSQLETKSPKALASLGGKRKLSEFKANFFSQRRGG